MDIITVSQTLLRWGIPALIGGGGVLALCWGAYRFYKKALHGRREITGRQAVCLGLLLCWLLLVLFLTSVSRGANFTGHVNLDFLSGYRSAWNNWSITELQLILFNMLMFAPLGFLLPLLWKKAERFRVTLAVSLGLTALIELFQLATGTGIFELDDLFHNLIGSLFGYFCIMAILSLVRERRLRLAPLARLLLIPCVIGLTLGVVFARYAMQPYGNMSILPAAPQDMSLLQVTADMPLSDRTGTASVYKNHYAGDKTYIRNVQAALAESEGLYFSPSVRREDENWVYTGTDAQGRRCQLVFFFRTGEWSYTTFAETFAQLTEDETAALRTRYEDWLQAQGLLPDSAVFTLQNGDTLRWDVAPAQALRSGTSAFAQGSVMIQFDDTGAPVSFQYQITWNEYAAAERIRSEAEAYAQVEQGNFEQYVPFQPGDELHVTGCTLLYLYDTKGFYQPAYQFDGYLNQPDNQWSCRIPALPQ